MVEGLGRREELVKAKQLVPIDYFPSIAPDEIWTEVTDQAIPNVMPGYYVSTYGQIFSCKKGAGLKSQTMTVDGYLRCGFRTSDGKYCNINVHRVVMLMFKYFPGCETMQVDHKDCNKTNNWIGNLRWCTCKENVHYAIENNLWNIAKGENAGVATITNAQAEQIAQMLAENKYGHQYIAQTVGCSVSIVHNINGGYCWKDFYDKYDLANRPPAWVGRGYSDEELERICQYMEQHAPEYSTMNDLFRALMRDLYGREFTHNNGTCLRDYFHGATRQYITQKYHPVLGGPDR